MLTAQSLVNAGDILSVIEGYPQSGDTLEALAAKQLQQLITISGGAGAVTFAFGAPQVIASTDGTPYLLKGIGTVSAISAIPATAASQISVSVAGGAAVTFPAGVGYTMDSGHADHLNANTIQINVIAGSVVFATRA